LITKRKNRDGKDMMGSLFPEIEFLNLNGVGPTMLVSIAKKYL
jgi:hypothetical protein